MAAYAHASGHRREGVHSAQDILQVQVLRVLGIPGWFKVCVTGDSRGP